MKIALFDIDDTITYETEFMKKHAPCYLKKRGLDVEIKDNHGYNLSETYGLRLQFQQKGYSIEESEFHAKKIENGFWKKYFLKYNFSSPRPDIKKIANELYKEGYQIHLVSTRGKKLRKNETKIDIFIRKMIVPLITKIMIKKGGIKYHQLSFVKSFEEKLEYINNYNPIYVFEDRIAFLEKLPEHIMKICINNVHNELVPLPANTVYVSDFEKVHVKIAIKYRNDLISKRIQYKEMKVSIYQNIAKAVLKSYFIFKQQFTTFYR